MPHYIKIRSKIHFGPYLLLALLSLILDINLGCTSENSNKTKLLSTTQSSHSENEILESYLLIQDQLASDQIQNISKEAQKIQKLAQDKIISDLAKTLSSDQKIQDARKHFKTLSSALIKQLFKADKKSRTDIIRLYCSMAGASWIQKPGPIRNPYYGKEMLECGEPDTSN